MSEEIRPEENNAASDKQPTGGELPREILPEDPPSDIPSDASEPSEQIPEELPEPIQESSGAAAYRYHWSYAAQATCCAEAEKRAQRRGILTYVLSLVSIFLVCLLFLAGVIIWYQAGNAANHDAFYSGADIVAVSEAVTPSTVLIYADGHYGTGFFIRSDGYIATNYHVVGGAKSIMVRLYSGEELHARFIDGSAADDLAVLKIAGENYPVVRIGDSASLKVGETAVAIGNPSGADGAWTTTQGIISALRRPVAVSGNGYSAEVQMIQTDVPLNSGNSGGPLCNARGEVIGIVTRKLTYYKDDLKGFVLYYEGIGFALPINEAMNSLSAMINGTYEQKNSTVALVRPSIGITVTNINAGSQVTVGNTPYAVPYNGVEVILISPGSGADGKLQTGDVIYAMDDKPVGDMNDLQEMLYHYEIGDSVVFSVFRAGQNIKVTVALGVQAQ